MDFWSAPDVYQSLQAVLVELRAKPSVAESSFPPTPLNLDTLSFGHISSIRKLSFPFEHPGLKVKLLGSSNGLVFVAFDDINIYIWNPSIGFFKELPVPGFSADHKQLIYHGAGYLSATDDYKVFAVSFDRNERTEEMEIFSLRAHVWKTIPHPGHNSPFFIHRGTLLNEALHWLQSHPGEILAFDLA
ncbi:F-box protein CPR1-like [Rosa chinensis]|uniref:F-box protein CPR1-like n=1 Tax=Rosa chinensis TaxID=74649 RepID=UPI000D08950E|nr:F-box protein CPR1-like [Rosa chinensis]